MSSYVFLRNEKEIGNLIENVHYQLKTLNEENEFLRKENQRLREEHFNEKELAKMSKLLEDMRADYSRGFPISKEEEKRIQEWQRKHDTEVHNNPNQYHGVSGGGYTYSFYPTAIGTWGNCICDACKSKAIKEKGIYWRLECEKNNAIFEFQQGG